MVCGLVEGDDMAAEDVLLERVVEWVMGGDKKECGESLLREIRYGLMETSWFSFVGAEGPGA